MNFAARTCVWGLLTITVPGFGIERPTGRQVTVNVYNDARVSDEILARAEQEATRIFGQAGVDTEWILCSSPEIIVQNDSKCRNLAVPTHLALRIIPLSSKSSDAIFGVAFLSAEGVGTYGDVFYDSVEKLHNEDPHASLPRVLGHVMAHEIGHLLLGKSAHSAGGIMRSSWQGQELRRIGMGTLFFTPQQARFMQVRLLSRLRAPSFFKIKVAGGLSSRGEAGIPAACHWTISPRFNDASGIVPRHGQAGRYS